MQCTCIVCDRTYCHCVIAVQPLILYSRVMATAVSTANNHLYSPLHHLVSDYDDDSKVAVFLDFTLLLGNFTIIQSEGP